MMKIKDKRGMVLLLTLFILSSILVVTLGAADLVLAGLRMNRQIGYSGIAFFAAETGLEQALWEVRKNNYPLPVAEEVKPLFGPSILSNSSSYWVGYASSTPVVTFTSTGGYGGVERAVRIDWSTQ